METQDNKNLTHFTVRVEQQDDDLILPLPQELLDQLGWDIGDTLVWTKLDNGGYSLSKKA